MFQHTSFPGRIIPLRDIYNIGNEIKDDYDRYYKGNPDFNSLKANLAPEILERYENIKKIMSWAKPDLYGNQRVEA